MPKSAGKTHLQFHLQEGGIWAGSECSEAPHHTATRLCCHHRLLLSGKREAHGGEEETHQRHEALRPASRIACTKPVPSSKCYNPQDPFEQDHLLLFQLSSPRLFTNWCNKVCADAAGAELWPCTASPNVCLDISWIMNRVPWERNEKGATVPQPKRDPGGQFKVWKATAMGWQSQHGLEGSFLSNHWCLHSVDITGLDTHKPTELSSNTTSYWSEAVTAGCQRERCTQLPKQHCKADLERKMLPSSGSTLGASGVLRTHGWLKQSIHMQA